MATRATKASFGPGPITVNIPGRGVDNLEAVQKVVANTLGRLGCGACLSGFDIRLRQVRDLVVNPKTFEVTEQFG